MTPTRQHIIRAIRQEDRHTIEDIARYCGLSETMVISVTQHMVEDGTLDEGEVVA